MPFVHIKVKVKVTRGLEGVELWLYSFSTSALGEVGGQHHASTVLPLGKTRYPLYRRLGGSQGRSGRVRKISPPPGFNPRTVQPVVSRYTDWATRPTIFTYKWRIIFPQISSTIRPQVGQSILIIEASQSQPDTRHSTGLLWTSDRPDTETSTWQHTTPTKDVHARGGIRNRSPGKREAADPRL
jgi:hypothetical protein